MKAITIKPETRTALNEIAVDHQYNQFVRVGRLDAAYHFGQGRKILVMLSDRGYIVENADEIKAHGKKFIVW